MTYAPLFSPINVVCMGERRNAYRDLVRKSAGKLPLGRLRYTRRWEDEDV
jgi:hypothetical protein